jgi:ferredoxin
MKIKVDRGRCTGIGMCESISPDYFEVGDDGVLVLLRDQPDESHRAEVEEAIRACPALALSIVED